MTTDHRMKFTTSWDDGPLLDIRLAELLGRFSVTGTFYVCPAPQPYCEELLTRGDLRSLANAHEIGAHTMTHARLTRLSPETARREIVESKAWVENATEKPCAMFCYPYGDHNASVRQFVSEAGFSGARTCEDFAFASSDPFLLGTSLQVYPFPLRPILSRRMFQPLLHRHSKLRAIGVPLRHFRSWLSMAQVVFDWAYETRQSWFHLWGHSWELERYGMWKCLDAFLAHVRSFPDIEFVVNSALVSPRHTP